MPPEIVEILKAITGANAVDINGKGRDIVSEPLPGKVFAATNDLLTFTDDSGVFFDRLVYLKFTRSFFPPDHADYLEGQEQGPDLETKLENELPGILNWAVQGLRRVREKKHFTQPASSLALKNEFAEDGSPIKRYVSDCLIRVPSGHVLSARSPRIRSGTLQSTVPSTRNCSGSGPRRRARIGRSGRRSAGHQPTASDASPTPWAFLFLPAGVL